MGIFALGSAGTVVIGHHFLFDMRTPFQPDSSNKFIFLTGKHTMDNAVMIDPAEGFALPNNASPIRYPSWTTLAAATDGSAISTITSPASGPEERRFRPFIPLPAWLAAILMESGSEDAAKLCIIAIHAIRDFNTRATSSSPTMAMTVSQEEKDEDEDDTMTGDFVNVTTPDSVRKLLGWVPTFLWAIAAKKIPGCTLQLVDTAPIERWCTMVRKTCFGPSTSIGAAPPTLPTSPSHLDLHFGAIVHSLECLAQLTDERTKQDQTDKEPKGFKKLEPFTQAMILFTSEPITDDVDTKRTQPVNSYTRLLQLGNVAHQAKIHLDHTLQVVHKCPVNLPYSTINAILNGHLTWADQTNPEVFSVFSCFKPGPSTMDMSSNDFLALQLKSAEGKGLSNADVARSTKVIHRIPHDEHQLGEFIAGFALVLSIIFGPKSTVCEAVSSWVTHICDNEMVYAQQMRADRAFGAKVLALIDRAVQLYFRTSLDIARRAGAARTLIFDAYQAQVTMNIFSFTTLPTVIALFVAHAQSPLTPTIPPIPPGGAPPALAVTSPGPHEKGPMVYNSEPFPSFKATPTQVSWLQCSLRSAPDWKCATGPCKPCPRYLSGGKCHAACPWAATHRAPHDDEVAPYVQWLRAWGQQCQAGPNQQSSGKKKRSGSPAPDGQDGKKVRFNPQGTTEPTPDF